MESEDVVVPGARDVRGTLDRPDDVGSAVGDASAREGSEAAGDGAVESGDDVPRVEAAVAACPPHPQHGGSRSDGRLRAVSEALVDRGRACLRFDYGEWAGGTGERRDALAALGWLGGRYDRVGLLGYSFGAGVALLAAAAADSPPAAVSVLSPAARLDGELDAVDALESVAGAGVAVQVVYGSRDDTVDWEPVADRARALGDAGHDVELAEFGADHFFVGQRAKVAEVVVEFLDGRLE